MEKEEKKQLLKSIFEKSNPVGQFDKNQLVGYFYGFNLEPINSNTCTKSNEIIFDNIEEAISIISETKEITNKTLSEMREEIISLCKNSNIDSNNKF